MLLDFRRLCHRSSESSSRSSTHSILPNGHHDSAAFGVKDALSISAHTASISSCPSSLSSARSFASSDVQDHRLGSVNAAEARELNRHVHLYPLEPRMGPRHAAIVSEPLQPPRRMAPQADLRSATVSGPLQPPRRIEPHAALRGVLPDSGTNSAPLIWRLPPPRPVSGERSLHQPRKQSPVSVFSTSCSRNSSCDSSGSCTCSFSSSSNYSPTPRKNAVRDDSFGSQARSSSLDLEVKYSIEKSDADEPSDIVPECGFSEVSGAAEAKAESEERSTLEKESADDSSKVNLLRETTSQWRLPEAPVHISQHKHIHLKKHSSGRHGISHSTAHTKHLWMRHLAPTADVVPNTWLDLGDWTNCDSGHRASTGGCLWAPERLWASPQQQVPGTQTNRYMSRQTSQLRSLSKLPQPPEDAAGLQPWHEVADDALDADVAPALLSKQLDNQSKHQGLHMRKRCDARLKLQNHFERVAKDEQSCHLEADPWSTFVEDADEQICDGHSIPHHPRTNSWSSHHQHAIGEWKSTVNMLKVRRKRLKAEVEQAWLHEENDQKDNEVQEEVVQPLDASTNISLEPVLSSGEEDWCNFSEKRALEHAGADTSEALPCEEPPSATWRDHRRSSQIRPQVESPSQRSSSRLAQNTQDAFKRIKQKAAEKAKILSVLDSLSRSSSPSRRAKLTNANADTWFLDDGHGLLYGAQGSLDSKSSSARTKKRHSNEGAHGEIPQVDGSKSKQQETRRAVKFSDDLEKDGPVSPRAVRKPLQRLKMVTVRIMDEPELAQKRVNRKVMQSSKQPKRATSLDY